MNITVGQEGLALTYTITIIGSDVLITVTGGEAHIGSVAVGDCGIVTVYTAAGHRDNALAESLAKEISGFFSCICTVAAGFHQDNLTKEDIAVVLHNHEQGSKETFAYLMNILATPI